MLSLNFIISNIRLLSNDIIIYYVCRYNTFLPPHEWERIIYNRVYMNISSEIM